MSAYSMSMHGLHGSEQDEEQSEEVEEDDKHRETRATIEQGISAHQALVFRCRSA